MKLEKISICNLCGNSEFNAYLKKDNWQLVKCRKCSLVFLDPRPVWEEVCVMYGNDQYSYLVGDKRYIDTQEERIRDYGKAVEEIEKFRAPGRLLEVGSATGFFLEAARRKKWKVWGVDICAEGVRVCRERFNIETFCGRLSDAKFAADFFDVICMYHTLEHAGNPAEFLEQAYRVLRPGGLLVIEVPNISSIKARFLKDKWPGIALPAHFFHFNAATISAYLIKQSFEIIRAVESEMLTLFAVKRSKTEKIKHSRWQRREYKELIRYFVSRGLKIKRR